MKVLRGLSYRFHRAMNMAKQKVVEVLDFSLWAVAGIAIGLAIDDVIVGYGIGIVIGSNGLLTFAAHD